MNRTLIIRIALGTMSVLGVLVTGLFLFVKHEPSRPGAELAALLTGELQTFDFALEKALAPDTPFVDAAGRTLTLKDYRGKVILLNLWATWCAPCLNEMPTLDRLKADMASDKFDVLAISVDKAGLEKSGAFLARTGAVHLDLLVDETMDLNFALSVYQLPTTILFDAKGVEIGRVAGDTVWDAPEVKRFLNAVIEAGEGSQGSSSLSQ